MIRSLVINSSLVRKIIVVPTTATSRRNVHHGGAYCSTLLTSCTATVPNGTRSKGHSSNNSFPSSQNVSRNNQWGTLAIIASPRQIIRPISISSCHSSTASPTTSTEQDTAPAAVSEEAVEENGNGNAEASAVGEGAEQGKMKVSDKDRTRVIPVEMSMKYLNSDGTNQII
jgi:hypothetical protein